MNLNSFSSYFNSTIVDNNGIAVSDINLGIKELYENIILPSDKSDYKLFVVTEDEQGFPDLIARKYFGDQNLWYYFLLSNALEDPFKEITLGWAYGIVDSDLTSNTIETAEEKNLDAQSRIGTTVTLN